MRDLPRSLDAAAGPHVVNFFRWLKRGLKANIASLNDVETYYVNRTRVQSASRRAVAAENNSWKIDNVQSKNRRWRFES